MTDRIRLLTVLALGTMLTAPAYAQTGQGYTLPFETPTPPPAPNGTLIPAPTPPMPSANDVMANDPALANPTNTPVTGSYDLQHLTGGEAPPSLEALQDTRPNDEKGDGLKNGRRAQLTEAAHTYGAQGGLAGRSFAINQMLQRYEPTLDSTFDFRPLVQPVGDGQTLMQPPIVTQAQMAMALSDSGQVARETRCVFEITREAQLTSAPPNWRNYLVRSWSRPRHPASAALPLTNKEVRFWNTWVAEGWADGEKQAVEIFLSDLSRLESDYKGMARYRVLLHAGRVEEPRVVFENRAAVGGGDMLHLDDRVIRITGQPGLQGNIRKNYGYPENCR